MNSDSLERKSEECIPDLGWSELATMNQFHRVETTYP